jgi:hypothetical protein
MSLLQADGKERIRRDSASQPDKRRRTDSTASAPPPPNDAILYPTSHLYMPMAEEVEERIFEADIVPLPNVHEILGLVFSSSEGGCHNTTPHELSAAAYQRTRCIQSENISIRLRNSHPESVGLHKARPESRATPDDHPRQRLPRAVNPEGAHRKRCY